MPSLKNNILGNLRPEQFLHEYWQKKPCLIRQALPDYQCPLSPDELAGLACGEGVESRLILEKGGKHPWQVKYGPFAKTVFRSLPKTHWTLLVQGVEQYHRKIYALLDHFRFVPNWRIDDVMISYAAPHGGTGPHLDSYDVFLLQGRGRRRWQINRAACTEKDFIPDLELRIIRNFHSEQEWVLEPGDMLYLPPRSRAQRDCAGTLHDPLHWFSRTPAQRIDRQFHRRVHLRDGAGYAFCRSGATSAKTCRRDQPY